MSCLGGAVGRVISGERTAAVGDGLVGEHAAEHLEGGARLVVGDFVAGFVDAHEGEVASLADLAELGAVDGEGDVAGSAELGCVRVVESDGDRFAAEPVADVVGVAVVQVDTDRVVQ